MCIRDRDLGAGAGDVHEGGDRGGPRRGDSKLPGSGLESSVCDLSLIHICRTERQAQEMKQAMAERLQTCGLELHPEKTKIVYCKDDFRKSTYPNEKFDFLGYTFSAKEIKESQREVLHQFQSGGLEQSSEGHPRHVPELETAKAQR